jgi:hypothetical protein
MVWPDSQSTGLPTRNQLAAQLSTAVFPIGTSFKSRRALLYVAMRRANRYSLLLRICSKNTFGSPLNYEN